MTARACIALLSAALALAACRESPDTPSATPASPQPATEAPAPSEPTPLPSSSSTVSVMPTATPCGAEKLQDYLNLLPTSTAKEEIARTLGHNRVRYVGLAEAKATASPESVRVTAGMGVDGRIKEFSCG